MCGIVGFAKSDCLRDVLDALKTLEYRGYDSAGVAYLKENGIGVRKRVGGVDGLRGLAHKSADYAIGHTRWATHGKVSRINAHPHVVGDWAIVHNGIITNYLALRGELERLGHKFLSSTDSEVIAHLLDQGGGHGDVLSAIRYAMGKLEGSYAVAVLCRHSPHRIYLFKRGNPLVVGKGDGFGCFASDTPALVAYTQRVYKMQDGEIAAVGKREILFWTEDGEDSGSKRQFGLTSLTPSHVAKGDYDTYMRKEIDEIPLVVSETYQAYAHPPQGWKDVDRWILIGCGTAYHACLTAGWGRAKVSSEFDGADVDEHTGVIAVTQSGETADTLSAMRRAADNGAWVVAVTNVPNSSATHLAHLVLQTKAGAEIAVAATKSFNAQLAVLKRIGEWLGVGTPSPSPNRALAETIAASRDLERLGGRRWDTVFLLGTGRDYVTCLEGGLKLKEIAYCHCETCYSGEIKHGPLALVTAKTLVIVVCTEERGIDPSMTALAEVSSRGATTLVISGYEGLLSHADYGVRLPEVKGWEENASIIPLQLLALHSALARGNDPDRPRNLAKSVTVK